MYIFCSDDSGPTAAPGNFLIVGWQIDINPAMSVNDVFRLTGAHPHTTYQLTRTRINSHASGTQRSESLPPA